MLSLLLDEYAYHRFVKTTPKPKATKKSSGELVGPPPPPPPVADVVAAGTGVVVVASEDTGVVGDIVVVCTG